MAENPSIHDLMSQIREFVNDTHKHYELRQNAAKFSQLVSALDTIEDAEEAVLAFPIVSLEGAVGFKYLAIYGLLQALFIQQDAVTHLCEALGIQNHFKNYPRLLEIRGIRNDSIGHPTNRRGRNGKPTAYNQILRMTMSKQKFQLLSHYGDGTHQSREVVISDIISEQRQFVSQMLIGVLGQLKAEHKAHKEKFRMEKLAQIFLGKTGYALEKANEALYSENNALSMWGLEEIKTIFHQFLDAVGRRDMDRYEALKADSFPYIDFAIASDHTVD